MAQIKRLQSPQFLQKYRLVSLGFIITLTETTARVPRLSELSVSVLTLLLPGCKNDNKHCKMGEEGGRGGAGF